MVLLMFSQIRVFYYLFCFFNDTATTEIYTYCTLFPYTTLFRSAYRPVLPRHLGGAWKSGDRRSLSRPRRHGIRQLLQLRGHPAFHPHGALRRHRQSRSRRLRRRRRPAAVAEGRARERDGLWRWASVVMRPRGAVSVELGVWRNI